MAIAERIVCPDCGGRCNLALPVGPDDRLEPGDVLTYACEDCLSRWDVVLDEEDLDDES